MRKSALSLLMIMIFLAGCGGGTETPPENVQTDFRVGTQGLVMNFVSGNPPPKLYEGDSMEIVVEYANKGAYDISGGYLYLSGYDREYLTFYPDQFTSIAIEGKDIFNPDGGIAYTTFSDDAVSMPSGTDIFSQSFKVTACYKYKTEASAEVCIDPDPLNYQPEEKVCRVSGISMSSQGAPVAVTHVDETSSKDRVQFKVVVGNVGGGTLIDNRKSIANCHSDIDRTDINKVDIKARFSNKELNCEPSTVRLVNGQGFSYCSYQGDIGSEAYKTSLNIELFYGYRQSISKTTQILRIP